MEDFLPGNGMAEWPISRKHLEYIVDKYAYTPSPVNGHKFGKEVSKLWLIKHLNAYSHLGFVRVMLDFKIAYQG